jgi:hypothetical protein
MTDDDTNVIVYRRKESLPSLQDLLARIESLEVKVTRAEWRLWDIEIVTHFDGGDHKGSAA